MKKCINILIDNTVTCPHCRKFNNTIKIYINYSNEIICCICLDKLDNKSRKYSICGDIRHALHSNCYKKYIKYNKNKKLTNNNTNILFISYLFIILHLLRMILMSLFII